MPFHQIVPSLSITLYSILKRQLDTAQARNAWRVELLFFKWIFFWIIVGQGRAAQGKDDFWNANISTFTAFPKILQTKAIFLKNVFPLKSNPGQRFFNIIYDRKFHEQIFRDMYFIGFLKNVFPLTIRDAQKFTSGQRFFEHTLCQKSFRNGYFVHEFFERFRQKRTIKKLNNTSGKATTLSQIVQPYTSRLCKVSL